MSLLIFNATITNSIPFPPSYPGRATKREDGSGFQVLIRMPVDNINIGWIGSSDIIEVVPALL